MRIIYYDFKENMSNIKKITKGFDFDFKPNLCCLTCINIFCFNEHPEILDEIKMFKLDQKKSLLVFYGKLFENYNGDDHVRFLKSNDLHCCIWANNPYLILPALRMAEIIRI